MLVALLGPYLCHHRMDWTISSKARPLENAGPILVLPDKEDLLSTILRPLYLILSIPFLKLMFS